VWSCRIPRSGRAQPPVLARLTPKRGLRQPSPGPSRGAGAWHDAAVEQPNLFSDLGVDLDAAVDHRPPSPLVAATDGSCLRNPGPGGWCWFVSEECWAAGAEDATTNNRMELLSVAMLLEVVPSGSPVHIQADSTYVIDALVKWRHGWKRRGWRTASGAPVKNRDLIEHLDVLMDERAPTFEWVRGHTGHAANEAADERARAAAEALQAGRPWFSGPGIVAPG
jgi:ribonuclease HI